MSFSLSFEITFYRTTLLVRNVSFASRPGGVMERSRDVEIILSKKILQPSGRVDIQLTSGFGNIYRLHYITVFSLRFYIVCDLLKSPKAVGAHTIYLDDCRHQIVVIVQGTIVFKTRHL